MTAAHTALQAALQLCDQGRFDEALAVLTALLDAAPGHIEAWILVAKLHYQRRHFGPALSAATAAATLDPHSAQSLYLLGRIHRAEGRLEEAERCYRAALRWDAANPDLLTSLGVLLRARGRGMEAIDCYRLALAMNPAHAEAQFNLRNAQTAPAAAGPSGSDESRATLLKALQAAPGDASVCLRLGILDCATGRAQSGLEYVERAATLAPGSIEAHEIARRICLAAGLHERAIKYADLMLVLAPTAEIAMARSLSLPAIQASRQSIAATRERWSAGLAEARRCSAHLAPAPAQVGSHVFAVASHIAFYLAYHGENNRDLQRQLAQVYTERTPELQFTADHCRRPQRRTGRLRIGFISRFLRKHSIGMTTRGLIAQLSRDRFEVYALRITPSAEDPVTRAIRETAEHTIDLHAEVFIAREQIAALELDVLFYQDIGMEPTSYFLAFARLARVQCVSFGHPDTTGLPNMDYFVSNDLFEPDNAQDHYSERLFLLKGLPTLAYYYKPDIPAAVPRERFGFSAGENVYLCPQTLFKLHPDFDALLDGILSRDPQGVVVLIDGTFREVSEQLRDRLRRTIPGSAQRVRFLPRLDYGKFLELLSTADVILDTPHFNGMNTSLEAFAAGTPVVTWPTALQRGRHTQAMYRTMRIEDCIAAGPQHYVEIAVRVGTDRAYAASLRRRILAANHVLFEEQRVVREFERFFIEATHAAAAGLPGSGHE